MEPGDGGRWKRGGEGWGRAGGGSRARWMGEYEWQVCGLRVGITASEHRSATARLGTYHTDAAAPTTQTGTRRTSSGAPASRPAPAAGRQGRPCRRQARRPRASCPRAAAAAPQHCAARPPAAACRHAVWRASARHSRSGGWPFIGPHPARARLLRSFSVAMVSCPRSA